MRWGLIAALVGCWVSLAEAQFVVTERHELLVDTAPIERPPLTINSEALEGVAASRRREVWVFSPEYRCVPCERTQAACGDGDDEVQVIYKPAAEADFVIKSFPAVFLPDVRQVHWGYTDLPYLKRILAANPRPPNVSAVTIGTIRGRAVMEAILAALQTANGEVTLQVGPVTLTLPAELQTTLSLSHDAVGINFPAKRPRVQVGSGWFAVSRELSHIRSTATLVMVGIEGCPDVAFVLE